MKVSWRTILVLVAIVVATAVSQSFGRFTYALLLTDIRDEFALSNTLAGSLGSGNLAAYFVGSLTVIAIVGRVGLTLLAQASVALVSYGLLVLAFSDSAALAATGLVITGFAAAGVWIAAPALATAALGDSHRGTAIGIAVCGVGLGMVAASGLDATFSWRDVYLVQAAIGLLATAMLVCVLRRGASSSLMAPGLSAIRVVPRWKSLIIAYGAFSTAMSLVITFLVALLEDDAGYSPSEASFAFSMLGIGSVLGGPVVGMIADRLGRRFALVAAFSTMAVSTLAILTGHAPGATLAAFVFGLSFTGGPVAVTVVISDYTKGAAFGAAYGIATIVFSIGLTIGPQLGGWMADLAGSFRPVFVLAIGCALVSVVLTCTRSERRPEPVR